MGTVTKRKTSQISESKFVNPEAKAFGQRASQIKESKNISNRILEERSGLSRKIIQNTLAGVRYPKNHKEFNNLADAFEISLERSERA